MLVRWIAVLGLLLTTGCGIVLDDEIGVPVTTSTVPGALGGAGPGTAGPVATLPGGEPVPGSSTTSTSAPPALRYDWCDPLGAAMSLAQDLGSGEDIDTARATIGQLSAITGEIVADPDAPADLVAVATSLISPLEEFGNVADAAEDTDALADTYRDFGERNGVAFDRLVTLATSACLGTTPS